MQEYQRDGQNFQLVGYVIHSPIDRSPADSAEIISTVRAVLGDETFERVRAGFRTNHQGIDVHCISAPDAEKTVFALYATATKHESALNYLREFPDDEYHRVLADKDQKGKLHGGRDAVALVTPYVAQPISYLQTSSSVSTDLNSPSTPHPLRNLEKALEVAPPKPHSNVKPLFEEKKPQRFQVSNGNLGYLTRAFNEALVTVGYEKKGTLEYGRHGIIVAARPNEKQLLVEIVGLNGEPNGEPQIDVHAIFGDYFVPVGDGAQYALRKSIQKRYASSSVASTTTPQESKNQASHTPPSPQKPATDVVTIDDIIAQLSVDLANQTRL